MQLRYWQIVSRIDALIAVYKAIGQYNDTGNDSGRIMERSVSLHVSYDIYAALV